MDSRQHRIVSHRYKQFACDDDTALQHRQVAFGDSNRVGSLIVAARSSYPARVAGGSLVGFSGSELQPHNDMSSDYLNIRSTYVIKID